MIVLLRRRAGRDHAQASRHAEMENQVPVAAVDEQVLAASSHAAHRASGERKHRLRHRPAQPGLTHFDSRDDAPRQMRREPAARDFDFGKLRHSEI
jgi:hypothetical protein